MCASNANLFMKIAVFSLGFAEIFSMAFIRRPQSVFFCNKK